MHRGLSRIAVVIALGLAAFNAATMSLSPAQSQTSIPDSEREYRQATWSLLNSIKNRQVRQDRFLGFGFGATVALLIGLGIVTLKRRVSHVMINPNAAPSEPPKQRMQELSRSWIQQLAKLRLDAHHASLARRQKHITRRQKRIRSLLWQMRSQMVSLDAEINQQFRKALENLVRETERLEIEADVQNTPKDQVAKQS